jgi:hypothetical protein
MSAHPSLPEEFDEPDDVELMTDWERGFVDSVESQDYALTDRQQEKLDQIEAELVIRRRLWREGRFPRFAR